MSVTKSQLDRVNVKGILRVRQHFGDGRTAYEDAESTFAKDVANRIRSGDVWTGVGAHDASKVAETNALALTITKLNNETVWLTLDAFAMALQHAQAKLRHALTEAAENWVSVAEDGSTSHADPTQSPYIDSATLSEQRALASAVMDPIERRAKGALAFAHIADQSCSDVISRLSDLTPDTTDVVDPDALSANRHALAGALATRKIAVLNRDFWYYAKPKDIPKDTTGKDVGRVLVDVLDVQQCAAGVVKNLSLVSLVGLPSSLGKLVKDAKKVGATPSGYKPVPPDADPVDELLTDAYKNGKAKGPAEGEDFTPDPSAPGAPPEKDKHGDTIPYKELTDIGPRKDSDEVLVVDESSGDMYYSDDGGKSFVKLG